MLYVSVSLFHRSHSHSPIFLCESNPGTGGGTGGDGEEKMGRRRNWSDGVTDEWQERWEEERKRER